MRAAESRGPAPHLSSTVATRIDALRGGGESLAPSLRDYFEPRFGRDLGSVRLHTGAAADETSRAIDARAFTVGSDIAFRSGAFQPESHDGRRLLAHELTHVVQQASGDASPRVQRKKRPGKNLSIVKITAFEGRLDSAQAELSDRTLEPIVLISNTIAPGTHVYERDLSQPTHYREALETGERARPFLWSPASVLEGTYDRAEKVEVEIISGDPSTLRAGIAALDPAIREALTSSEGSGPVSYASLEHVLNAGQILEQYGVTADELALLEYRRQEEKDYGREPAEALDPVEWASTFVAGRQLAAEAALSNRASAIDARKQIDAVPDDWATLIRMMIAKNADASWPSIEEILRRQWGIRLADAIAAFEVELRSITNTFLSQALLALYYVERRYLADRNVGMELERLRQAMKTARPSVFRRREEDRGMERGGDEAGRGPAAGRRDRQTPGRGVEGLRPGFDPGGRRGRRPRRAPLLRARRARAASARGADVEQHPESLQGRPHGGRGEDRDRRHEGIAVRGHHLVPREAGNGRRVLGHGVGRRHAPADVRARQHRDRAADWRGHRQRVENGRRVRQREDAIDDRVVVGGSVESRLLSRRGWDVDRGAADGPRRVQGGGAGNRSGRGILHPRNGPGIYGGARRQAGRGRRGRCLRHRAHRDGRTAGGGTDGGR
ncbi:MAG: hypothetical protein DMF86_03670 [Acidobacteria bacterium]|nr:MAG: hypothetical protein DMF86_03670 [Acidobacteriota bacterium]